MKHYMDIRRLRQENAVVFKPGDHIIIQEKIDGANFSICYDEETNSVKSFSRKTELTPTNDLRGAYLWSQRLDVDKVKSCLGSRYILFCEWLVKHTVKYPQDKYQNAYAYDIYDTVTEKYLCQSKVAYVCAVLGIQYVPVFYDGEFTSWDDVKKYVGYTKLGGERGEGVVVKNQTMLDDPDNRLEFYVKIVSDEFSETKAHKNEPKDPQEAVKKQKALDETGTIVTRARVEKMLHKFVDEGLIPENWDETHMSTIAKNIGKRIIEDCIKEEPDVVAGIDNFSKCCSSICMKITRDILKEKFNA